MKSHKGSLGVLTTLFFMWGFMTVLNDLLIPQWKAEFNLNYMQALLVQFAFFGAYFVGSIIYFAISSSSGDPIGKIGYKNGLILGLLVAAAGSFLFYPAAMAGEYYLYLLALFVVGLGFTLLQIAANPYVAVLGSPESASSRLNLTQGFNSLGTTLGPLLGAWLIFEIFGGKGSVKMPYVIFGSILTFLAVVIFLVPLPKIINKEKIKKGFGALQFPNLSYGMLAIFFYVGGEVAIGSLLVSYIGLPEIAGVLKEDSDTFLSFYWGGLMIGRFAGAVYLSDIEGQSKKLLMMVGLALAAFGVIYFANWTKTGIDLMTALPLLFFVALAMGLFVLGRSLAHRTLALFSMLVIALLLVVIFGSGSIAFWAIIGIGIFNSIMWSNIFTLAIDGLEEFTSQGSSLLVMMIVGGALVPLAQGKLADILATNANPDAGLQMSFFVPLLCYLYLVFYGLKGYQKKVVS